jgi:hypothetical protein
MLGAPSEEVRAPRKLTKWTLQFAEPGRAPDAAIMKEESRIGETLDILEVGLFMPHLCLAPT